MLDFGKSRASTVYDPSDVANTVLHLMSDASPFVNGADRLDNAPLIFVG